MYSREFVDWFNESFNRLPDDDSPDCLMFIAWKAGYDYGFDEASEIAQIENDAGI